MPLHERDTVRQQLEDCVFVGRDLTAPVPKYRFPRDETRPKQASLGVRGSRHPEARRAR
jgi:glutamate decarboxylase